MKFKLTLFFLIIFCKVYCQDSILNGYKVFYKTPFIETIQPKKARNGKIKTHRMFSVPFFMIPRIKPDSGMNGEAGFPGDDFEIYLRKDTLGLVIIQIRNVDKKYNPDIIFYIDLSKTYMKLTFRGGEGGDGSNGGNCLNNKYDECESRGGNGGDGGIGGRVGMVDVYFNCDTFNIEICAFAGIGGKEGIGGNRGDSFQNKDNCSANKGENGAPGANGQKINDVVFIFEIKK